MRLIINKSENYLSQILEGSLEVESVDGFQYDEVTVDDEFSVSGKHFLKVLCSTFRTMKSSTKKLQKLKQISRI